MARATILHQLHDLGAAAWFGGTLANAVAAAGATEPGSSTPSDVASAQRMLARLQWAVPALTGAIVAIGSFAAEQYRPEEVGRGLLNRIAG